MAADSQLLDGMVIFVEVVNGGSFTSAAVSSGHSTSYISKEINKLEERLGARLLNRTTRSLSLTPEGELYFQRCQQIVDDAEQASCLLAGQQQEPKGTLKVSCPVSFGLSRIRPVIAKFIARYPKINLELQLDDRKVDMVSEGYDIAIRASGKLEDSGLISRKFMQSHAVVVASPAYLAKHGTPSHPSELSEHQTISYSNLKNPKNWAYYDSDHSLKHVSVNSRVLTNSPQLEIALCCAGQGITRMPLFNLSNELASGELIELFDTLPKTQISVFLVYASRKHMSSKVRCFIDYVIATLGDNNVNASSS